MIPAEEAAIETLRQYVAAHAPATVVQGYTLAPLGFDTTAAITLIAAALAVALLLTGAAFVVAALDRMVERRRQSATLSVVGAPRRVVVGSEVTFIAVPLLMGAATATAVVGVAGYAWSQLTRLPAGPLFAEAAPTLWAVAALVPTTLVVVALFAMSGHRVTAEALRRA